MLNKIYIKLLSEKCGKDITHPSGVDFLRNDIEAVTGEALSLNTLKRLIGLLPYESLPRRTTLDILAKYLGYSSWELFEEGIHGRISDFNTPSGFIDMAGLEKGQTVVITWNPERQIRIIHQGKGRYIVEDSINSKLSKNDILYLSQVAKGFPFMVKEVVREGKSLGNYTAAQLEGVTFITLING